MGLFARGYDDVMSCAPEDRQGYGEQERPLSQAERLMSATNAAAAYLRSVEGASICLGVMLPEHVVKEIAELTRTPVVLNSYEPSERHCAITGSEPGLHTIFSFEYRAHGVLIHGQGSRPATEAEKVLP